MEPTVSGIVQQGKRMGRTMGFPTANLAILNAGALPEDGVYVGIVTLEDGQRLPCVLNQGKHPTLPEGQASIEAHILGYEGDLYGKRIGIQYLQKLRPEQKFASVEALIQQIARDKADAQAFFKKNGMNA